MFIRVIAITVFVLALPNHLSIAIGPTTPRPTPSRKGQPELTTPSPGANFKKP